MSGRLTGKLALVTGAAQGLGAAIARRLAAEGARVLLTDRNESGVKAVADELSKEFGHDAALFARHDVTSEGDWIDVIAYAREQLGGLSVLVNNAGIVLTGSVEDFTLDEWHQGMSVNTDSVFLGAKHALTLMRERQPGSIVNVTSRKTCTGS